jgi:hypothetical protein
VSKKISRAKIVASALNDEEWSNLQDRSGLPDRARRQLDDVVRFLCARPEMQDPWISRFQYARTADAAARRDFSRAMTSIEALIASEAPSYWEKAVMPRRDVNTLVPVPNIRSKLVRARDAVRDVVDNFPISDQYIPRGKQGRRISLLRTAMERLNDIVIAETGTPLNQSRRSVEFVLLVCQKGGLAVAHGAIKEHAKNIRKDTKKIRKITKHRRRD